MRSETFDTPGHVQLDIRVPSGRIDLEAVEGTQTLVELDGPDELIGEARIESRPRGDGFGVTVVVEERGFFKRGRGEVRARVTIPKGADVDLSTASADVEARGELGEFEANTASGDVRVQQIGGEAQVNSASGDVKLDSVGGRLTVNTASGDLEVGHLAGDGKVRAASGDIQVGEAESSLKVQTASGDVEVGSVREGEIVLQTASGDIEVGVKRGSKVFMDVRSMSGETSSDLEMADAPAGGDGPSLEIKAMAMSGDVEIRRA
jgi:DUF4097 and DUF4098 domain-containing protein YvlB